MGGRKKKAPYGAVVPPLVAWLSLMVLAALVLDPMQQPTTPDAQPFEVGSEYSAGGLRALKLVPPYTAPLEGWREVERAHHFCSGGRGLDELHPKSLAVLARWSRGVRSDDYFLAVFHMPDSEYLGVAHCVIGVTRGDRV